MSAFLRDKTWQKLFDKAGNYQTVLATFVPEGGEYPVAGIGLQVGLEHHPEQWRAHYEQQLAGTMSRMRGRPSNRVRGAQRLELVPRHSTERRRPERSEDVVAVVQERGRVSRPQPQPFSGGNPSMPVETRATVDHEIRTLVDGFTRAVREMNIDALMTHYAPEPG
jgi:hypothetical protein